MGFLARLLLTVEQRKSAAATLADAIGPLDQWVANDHAVLLAGYSGGPDLWGDLRI